MLKQSQNQFIINQKYKKLKDQFYNSQFKQLQILNQFHNKFNSQ